jgi:Putative Actinobacterial Holin-X, holin superfamily III
MSLLVRDEIELAKAEMSQKVTSIARGAAAVAAGSVFGVFAIVFVLLTAAWGLNSLIDSLWLGFLIVLVVLVMLTLGAFLFAWRKFKVGAPAPTMALDEAKKIRETVSAKSEVNT